MLNAKIFTQEKRLAALYKKALPFPHVVLEPFFSTPNECHAIRAELEHMDFTFKETDLYALRQSIDMANLSHVFVQDPLQKKKLRRVAKLCDQLYSADFKGFIERITGCGPLVDKTDLAAAVYTNGSHLLVHDDVIGTRRVAFIIYFTDPAMNWCAEDGGALELYPKDPSNSGCPSLSPTTRLLPTFNKMTLFTVDPGVSFHSVQEVYAAEKDRISIQGWFHAASPPPGADELALPVLKKLCPRTRTPKLGCLTNLNPVVTTMHVPDDNGDLVPMAHLGLPDIVIEELKSLGVHPMYLDGENIAEMAQAYATEGAVRMAHFLMPPLYTPIAERLAELDAADGLGLGRPTPPRDDAGVSKAWALVGPPHIRRHIVLADEVEDDEEDELAQMMSCVRDRLFASDAFAKFIATLVSQAEGFGKLRGRSNPVVRRFRPGLDYSLNVGAPEKFSLVDVTWTVCNQLDEEDDQDDNEERRKDKAEGDDDEETSIDMWESCDFGGFDCYVRNHAETKEGGGAVVSGISESSDDVCNFPCQGNCLTLVRRQQDMAHFVKYLQVGLPGSRLEAFCSFSMDPTSGGEQEVDDGRQRIPKKVKHVKQTKQSLKRMRT